MSVWVTTHVWHNSQHRGTALLLMLALADQANDEGISWPSVSTLAHKTRLSDRTVQNLLPVVLESGEVEVVREAAGGHMPRVYRVFAPPPPDHRNRPPRGARPSPHSNSVQGIRGADSSPRETDSAPGVKNSASRGEESDAGVKDSRPGVKSTTSRGEARFTQTVLNRVNRQLEPNEPSRGRAREVPINGTNDEKTMYETMYEQSPCQMCGKPAYQIAPWSGLCGSCRRQASTRGELATQHARASP